VCLQKGTIYPNSKRHRDSQHHHQNSLQDSILHVCNITKVLFGMSTLNLLVDDDFCNLLSPGKRLHVMRNLSCLCQFSLCQVENIYSTHYKEPRLLQQTSLSDTILINNIRVAECIEQLTQDWSGEIEHKQTYPHCPVLIGTKLTLAD